MKVNSRYCRVLLDSQQYLRLEAAHGTSVRAFTGELWITQDGNPADFMLLPGDVFTALAAAPLIVLAHRPSELLIEEPPQANFFQCMVTRLTSVRDGLGNRQAARAL